MLAPSIHLPIPTSPTPPAGYTVCRTQLKSPSVRSWIFGVGHQMNQLPLCLIGPLLPLVSKKHGPCQKREIFLGQILAVLTVIVMS